MSNNTLSDKYKKTDTQILEQMDKVSMDLNRLALYIAKSKRPDDDIAKWLMNSEEGRIYKLVNDAWCMIYEAERLFMPLALEDEIA